MRRMLSLVGVLLVVGALFAGCGAGGSGKQTASAPAAGSAAPSTSAPKGAESKAPAAPASVPLPADRKIIQNAQFDVKVKDSDDAIAHISQVVLASGGYVQETRQSGTSQQGRTVNMTLRVPSAQYGSVVDLINGLGEVNQRRTWTDDVTEQYIDLEARIKTQEVHLTQLNKLYDRSGSIKEMMELEQEISRVTADLESMKGKIKVLANRVELSTIAVNLYEPGVPTPIQAPKNVWDRVRLGFTGSWNGVINFTGNLVVLLATLIPVLLYLAVFGGVIYAISRWVRGRGWSAVRGPVPPAAPPMPLQPIEPPPPSQPSEPAQPTEPPQPPTSE